LTDWNIRLRDQEYAIYLLNLIVTKYKTVSDYVAEMENENT